MQRHLLRGLTRHFRQETAVFAFNLLFLRRFMPLAVVFAHFLAMNSGVNYAALHGVCGWQTREPVSRQWAGTKVPADLLRFGSSTRMKHSISPQGFVKSPQIDVQRLTVVSQ